MGLDAGIWCDCFEQNRLRSSPPGGVALLHCSMSTGGATAWPLRTSSSECASPFAGEMDFTGASIRTLCDKARFEAGGNETLLKAFS